MTKDYLGSVEYVNGSVDMIYHPEGRIVAGQYEYVVKDHLGNSRVAFADLNWDGKIKIGGPKSEITQENHYYPFGMNMEGEWASQIGPENKYQYNGKELNDEYGLDWNDYGARFYDAAIGRWTTVDPLAEELENISWSPYAYVWNTPINAIDPDGRNGILTIDKENKTIQVSATIHYSTEDFANSRNFTGEHNIGDFLSGLASVVDQYFQTGDVEVDGESFSVSTSITFQAHDTNESRDQATKSGDDKLEFMPVGLSNGSYTPGFGDKGGTFNIPKSNSSVSTPTFAHELGHSFGLGHGDAIIYEEPGRILSNGGMTGKSGSIMSYASSRSLDPSEMSKIVTPSVRMAKKKKRKNVQKFRVFSNRKPKRIKK